MDAAVAEAAEDEEQVDQLSSEGANVEVGANTGVPDGRTTNHNGRLGESSTLAVVRDVRGQRLRLDLEVEASGFGRAMQRELEDVSETFQLGFVYPFLSHSTFSSASFHISRQASTLRALAPKHSLAGSPTIGELTWQYMIEVQDMPQSDPEHDEDLPEQDRDSDEEDVEDRTSEPDLKDAALPAATAAFDEGAFQSQMASRLEKLRLDKALGNDEDYVSPGSEGDPNGDDGDSDSDSSSLLSDGPPQSDFTAYTRTRTHTSRPTAKKLDTNPLSLKNVVARQVEKEMGSKEKRLGSSKGRVGKAKGHKWKANPNYLVGGKGDGWS